MKYFLLSLGCAASVSVVGCSESTPASLAADAGSDAAVATLDSPAVLCVDTPDSIYGAPGTLPTDPGSRGAVLKCATDPVITKDAIGAKLTAIGYKGKAPTSGAKVYRVSYRTERGDKASTPSASSAIVYVPTTPRAGKLPVVVVARGTRGQAASCAASKLDPAADAVNPDFFRMTYSLVGNGYAVIVSDLAGYANFNGPGNPPSAYAQAADVGKSTLDSGRALKKLFPALDDKVVLVGHSQGGHSALSALALAETYGSVAPIVGVGVYAPLWLSQRTWGAILEPGVGSSYPIASAPTPNAVSVWYHYTQAELLDGPGEGMKLFAAGKQDKIRDFVNTACFTDKYPALESLGTYGYELFDPAFVQAVGAKSAFGGTCDPGSVCEKWISRYTADRPHLTGAALNVPILLLYGSKDTTIPPKRMRCAVDRLKSDAAKLTICVEPEATHGGIVDARGDYVSDWVASVALGGAAPAACDKGEAEIPAGCETPPPND